MRRFGVYEMFILGSKSLVTDLFQESDSVLIMFVHGESRRLIDRLCSGFFGGCIVSGLGLARFGASGIRDLGCEAQHCRTPAIIILNLWSML